MTSLIVLFYPTVQHPKKFIYNNIYVRNNLQILTFEKLESEKVCSFFLTNDVKDYLIFMFWCFMFCWSIIQQIVYFSVTYVPVFI